MKTYLSDKKKSSSTIAVIIWFLIIFSIIFYFFNTQVSGPVSNLISKTFRADNINASDLQQLQSENDTLRNENEELKILLRNARVNEEFINTGIIDLLESNILLSASSLVYSDVLINKGSDEGVENSSLVFTSGLIPVGKVKESYKNSSIVELFSTENNKIGAIYGQASSTINFTVYGDGAYGFYASVPHVLDIRVGDAIYLQENSAYSIGKVADIVDNINNKTKELYIRNDFNPSTVSKLYVEK